KAYAPLSYVAVFVVATLLFMAISGLGAWVAERVAKRGMWVKFQESAHLVNPLVTTFSHIRVALMDLADPETRVIRGKKFVNCEIIGRRLTFAYFGCIFDVGASDRWVGSDFVALPVSVNDQSMKRPGFANAYLVEQCVF